MTEASIIETDLGVEKVRNSSEKLFIRSKHSPKQERKRLLMLALIFVLLASIYPLLSKSAYVGGVDFHVTTEMVGATLGLMIGFVFITRFYAMGNHFHLFVGLAFFISGAEDLIHGLLSFPYIQQWTGFSASSLDQLISGTYVAGRLMMGILFILALYMPTRERMMNGDSKSETKSICAFVLLITVVATAVAIRLPFQQLIRPDGIITHPIYLFSAILLSVALYGFLQRYHQEYDTLTWWISLSIAVNIVGQVMMSFYRSLFDPFFDTAHVYKMAGYMIPLLGFSLYQIAIVIERKRSEEKARLAYAELDQIFNTAADGMRVIDKDFNMIRINETFYDLVGMTKEEVEGKKCYEVFYDSLCLTPDCPMNRILCEEEESVKCETEKERRDGVIIPCILTATPFFGPDGKTIGIVEDFKDLTEIKRAGDQLDELLKDLDKAYQKLKPSDEEMKSFTYLESNKVKESQQKILNFCKLPRIRGKIG